MPSNDNAATESDKPDSPTNPRSVLVHTARFQHFSLNNSGTGPIVMQRLASPEPPVQGGAWAAYVTVATGNGEVNFNLRLPDLNHLIPDHPVAWFEARHVTIEVHCGGNARLRLSPHLVHAEHVTFNSGDAALIDINTRLALNLNPSLVGKEWSVYIDATGWYSATGLPKTVASGFGRLIVECELPLAVGDAPELKAS